GSICALDTHAIGTVERHDAHDRSDGQPFHARVVRIELDRAPLKLDVDLSTATHAFRDRQVDARFVTDRVAKLEIAARLEFEEEPPHSTDDIERARSGDEGRAKRERGPPIAGEPEESCQSEEGEE